MEIEWQSIPHTAGEKRKTNVIKSDICQMDDLKSMYPTFELTKESIRFGKEFRKQFEKIGSTNIKLRLKMKMGGEGDKIPVDEPCEEFNVNFLQL